VLKQIKENKIIILLFITFVVIYLIAWNRGLELLYVIAELSLATLLLSLIAPYFNLLGISASVKYPKYSHQAQNVPITIELSTSNLFEKYLLEVWIKTPFSTDKNHMFFIKRLHGKFVIETELTSDIRGLHQIGPVQIQTGFPLGLKIVSKTVEDTQQSILVLPTPFEINNFPFSVDNSSIFHGENKSKRKGGNDEFVSVREYKQGDSPRHIHWPISAKKGELIVREYQDVLSSSLVIILDLNKDFNVGSEEESTLEYAITIASSLAIYGLNQGYNISIFGYGKEEIRLLDIKGVQNHLEILKKLAFAKSDGHRSYADVIKYFFNLQKAGGTLVLFDNGSGNVEKDIDIYSSKFSKPVLFDIEADSFKNNKLNREFQIQENSKYYKYSLKKGCDLKRMFS